MRNSVIAAVVSAVVAGGTVGITAASGNSAPTAVQVCLNTPAPATPGPSSSCGPASQVVVETATWPTGAQIAEATAACPAGKALLGGGGYIVGGNATTAATGPYPGSVGQIDQFPGGTQHTDGSFPSDAGGTPVGSPDNTTGATAWTTVAGSGQALPTTEAAWVVSYAVCAQ